MDQSSDEEYLSYDDDVDNEILSDENEILPSDDGDDDSVGDDDGIFDNDHRFRRFKIELKKSEMASDIEESDGDDDYNAHGNFLAHEKSWGKNKKIYYNTDFVDKGLRNQDHKDSNLARYEEEEALQIQKRLLTSFNEEDLGLGMLLDHKARKVSADKLTDKNDVTILPMNLNEKQKLAFIKHESPEVHFLHADFEKYLNEIIYETSPIIDVLKNRKDLRNSGWTYLKHRHFCLINYCANISFYMAMRCSKDSEIIKDHPIVKRLLSYKKILTELEEHLNNNPTLSKELSFLKEAIKNNHQIKFKAQISDTDDNHSKSDDDDDSDVQNDIDHNESLWNDDANLEANLDEETKRAITYEMKKNKGLTPKRKREQRNPRVKYRKKFEKATVRRKGQVREPRKELKKYSGEFTGINMKSVKSIKFK